MLTVDFCCSGAWVYATAPIGYGVTTGIKTIASAVTAVRTFYCLFKFSTNTTYSSVTASFVLVRAKGTP